MIRWRDEAVSAKRYAAKLLALAAVVDTNEWPPPWGGALQMTDAERAEVRRFLLQYRDRILDLLGEELPEHWRRQDGSAAGEAA